MLKRWWIVLCLLGVDQALAAQLCSSVQSDQVILSYEEYPVFADLPQCEPDAAASLSASPNPSGDGQYAVNWTWSVGSFPAHWHIDRLELEETDSNTGSTTTVTVSDPNQSSHSFSKPVSDNTFGYRVRACGTNRYAEEQCGAWYPESSSPALSVVVRDPQITVNSFTINGASATTINLNESFTIDWSIDNADSCNAQGGGWNWNVHDPALPIGSWGPQSADNDGSFTFTLNCSNVVGGSAIASVDLTVVNPPPSQPTALSYLWLDAQTANYRMQWQSGGGSVAVDHYILQEIAPSGSQSSYTISSGTNKTFVRSSGPFGDYRYQVKACNSSNVCSDLTDDVRVAVMDPAKLGGIPGSGVNAAVQSTPVSGAGSMIRSRPSNDQTIGRVAGSGGVSGGAATYSVPINVPPGRQGMQPSLAISYNSRAGNGPVGMGWTLSGLSAIHRCPQTVAQDLKMVGVQYEASDRLCLDGQRLIAVGPSSDYWAAGQEYRTEIDSFAKITKAGGGAATTTSSFTVRGKDNIKRSYGYRVNVGGNARTSQWLLSREEDPAGNSVNYHYTDLGDGEAILNYIAYTGKGSNDGARRVLFTYGNRSDLGESYIAGYKTRQTKRLTKITTCTNSSCSNSNGKVREYSLGYTYSAATERSILRDIEECGFEPVTGTPKCLDKTTLDWQSARPTYSYSKLLVDGQPLISDADFEYDATTTVRPTIRGMADFDGDGSRELGAIITGQENVVAVDSAKQEQWRSDDLFPGGINNSCVAFDTTYDINIDGRPDRLLTDNGNIKFARRKPSPVQGGTGFWQQFEPITTDISYTHLERALPVDLNGDAKVDVVMVRIQDDDGDWGPTYNDTRELIAYLNTTPNMTAGNMTFCPMGSNGHCADSPAVLADDFAFNQSATIASRETIFRLEDQDGDGAMDIVLGVQGIFDGLCQEKRTLFNEVNNGAAFVEKTRTAMNAGDVDQQFSQILDVNGDGLNDILHLKPVGTNYHWQLKLNLGDRSYANDMDLGINIGAEAMHPEGRPRFSHVMRAADWNNDGRVDLLVPRTFHEPMCSFDWPTTQGQAELGEDYCPNYHPNGTATNYNAAGPVLYDVNAGGDHSIYNMGVLQFELQSDGSYQIELVDAGATGIKAAASYDPYDVDDFFGDGLTDIVSTVGCQEVENPLEQNTYRCKASSPINDSTATPMMDRNFYISQVSNATPTGTLDLLHSVADGFDNISQWDYAPLSDKTDRAGTDLDLYAIPDTDRYVDEDAGDGHHFYFTSSMYVVSAMHQSNGLGSQTNRTYYGYEEAVYNNQGRGFQGFRTIHVEQDIGDGNDLRTTTWFHQVFPKAGQIESSMTYLASDPVNSSNPIAETVNNWGAVQNHIPNNSKVYFVRLDSSATDQHKLSSRVGYSSTSITNSYDEYGNITAQTTTVNDHGAVIQTATLTNTYAAADTANWWLNRLTRSQTTSAMSYSGFVPSLNGITDPETSKTVTRLINWDNNLRKPVCEAQVGGNAAGTCSGYAPTTTLPGAKTTTTYNTTVSSSLYGLPTTVSVSANGVTASRTTSMTYSADGYFPLTVENALNHKVTTVVDVREGNPLKITDANGLITMFEYDVFGRELERFYPQNCGSGATNASCSTLYNQPGLHYAPRVSTRYAERNGTYAEYAVIQVIDGAPEAETVFDALGRAIETHTDGFSDNVISCQKYNARGQLKESIEPRYGSTCGSYDTDYAYDALGRIDYKRQDRMTNSTLSTSSLYTYYLHDGLDTTVLSRTGSLSNPTTASCNMVPATLGSSLCVKRRYATSGQLLSTTDAHGGVTEYWHDSQGNPVVIEDPANNRTWANYNGLGQRTKLIDPNMGSSDFSYNGLGEVTWQKDAKNQQISNVYDVLGRLVQRTASGGPDGTIVDSWDFDTDGASNIVRGLLGEEKRLVAGTETYRRAYFYDEKAKGLLPTGHAIYLDGSGSSDYQVEMVNEDYYGRPMKMVYPGSASHSNGLLGTYMKYNIEGYLTEQGNAEDWNISSKYYRKVTAMNARGQVTEEVLGNGLKNQYNYYEATGQMEGSDIVSGATAIYEQSYQYDRWGNLNKQYLHNENRREQFTYDKLHRLTQSRRYDAVVGGILLTGGTVNYSYDSLGNIKHKSDYASTYTYGGDRGVCANDQVAGPNAVTIADGYRYGYDATGNLICGNSATGLLEMEYDPFHLPTMTARDSTVLSFRYGPDNQRYEQSGGPDGTITYIDKIYEQRSSGEYKLYIDDYAVFSVGGQNPGIRYLHKDRLGSIVAQSKPDGTLEWEGERGYDPFGKPREGDWNDSLDSLNDLNREDVTSRGFTGHEHLNPVQLIHMNGRAYDYNLGRFLSVDPFIQFPENSQSLNPYSYILNNPMSGTDPSGYSTCEAGSPDCDDGGGDPAMTGSRIKGVNTGATIIQVAGPQRVSDNGKDGNLTVSFKDSSGNPVDINSLSDRDATEVDSVEIYETDDGHHAVVSLGGTESQWVPSELSGLAGVLVPNAKDFVSNPVMPSKADLGGGLTKGLINLGRDLGGLAMWPESVKQYWFGAHQDLSAGEKFSAGLFEAGSLMIGGAAKAPGISSSAARSAAQLQRYRSATAASEIVSAERVGRALKGDAGHRAASFLSKAQLASGKVFPLRGGDNISRILLQTYGKLNNRPGVFEFILNARGQVSHQRFIRGGKLTGYPNQDSIKSLQEWMRN